MQPTKPGAGNRPASWHPFPPMVSTRNRATGYVVGVLGTVVLTFVLLPFRPDLTPLSKGFGYLVVVTAAAAIGGLGPGVAASILGSVLFNFYFLPPYETFAIDRAEYAVVLFVFLGLSVLISVLLARASDRARAAEEREAELRMLQELSGELVGLVPGRETYELLLSTVVERFDFRTAALFVQDDRGIGGLREDLIVGGAPGSLQPHWDPRDGGRPPERLPLSVGGRNLGLIVLQGDRGSLSSAESRVLRAFCDQLALVLERDRLLRSATQAEVYRQSDDLRRALLAAVSHDLRTPLAVIKTSVTDLLEPGLSRPEEERREALEAIDRESDRLNQLIANLLDMSRIEAGVLKVRIEPVNVVETVSDCAATVQARWPEARIAVAADGTSIVRADPVFLDRVATNLLENAAKVATDSERHEVRVSVSRVVDRITVRVADQGPGVPEHLREQIFHPFYRLSERNPRLGPGLGLAIAKGFLSLMDGEIWFEDTPGGGATLAFSLPAEGSA